MVREACGLFGVIGTPHAAELTYYGIFQQQHRGQESCGIASLVDGHLQSLRRMGLVVDNFPAHRLAELKSDRAIGHVRYSTHGSSSLTNAQPLLVSFAGGQIAVAHNGNLTNGADLRRKYEAQGSIFQTTSDTEIILHIFAHPEYHRRGLDGLRAALREIEGAFSLLFLTPDALIAARDPSGFRPLAVGRLPGGAYCVASETAAFDAVGAEYKCEVPPGEMLVFRENGYKALPFAAPEDIRPSHCIFEHVYFARPDSRVFGDNVSQVRERLGRRLAEEHPQPADLVVPVPDSGNEAALGYSLESGIRLAFGFIRNHYVGRTFIKPADSDRRRSIDMKLNVNRDLVAGQRVIVVDDSIIRGHTMRKRVRMLKDAGAREVHVRVSCPPTRHPCFYGIDFPTPEELIAAQLDVGEIAREFEADSLGYLSLDGLLSAVRGPRTDYCHACFSRLYPRPIPARGLGKLDSEPHPVLEGSRE